MRVVRDFSGMENTKNSILNKPAQLQQSLEIPAIIKSISIINSLVSYFRAVIHCSIEYKQKISKNNRADSKG